MVLLTAPIAQGQALPSVMLVGTATVPARCVRDAETGESVEEERKGMSASWVVQGVFWCSLMEMVLLVVVRMSRWVAGLYDLASRADIEAYRSIKSCMVMPATSQSDVWKG